MKPKQKALVFNFLAFALLFVLIRFGLGALVSFSPLVLAIIAGFSASILSPKFAAIPTEEGQRVSMKWIFMKGSREW